MQIPNRLSIEKGSPDYNKAALDKGIEVTFNGIRQVNCVISFDVEAGTLTRYRKTALGQHKRDEFHQPITETLTGVVGASWKD